MMHDARKVCFFPSLWPLTPETDLAVYGGGVSSSRGRRGLAPLLSYRPYSILSYSVPQMVIFVAAFALRRFESQIKPRSGGDGLMASPLLFFN